MDVFDFHVKLYYCDFNNKRNIAVQKIKVKKLVLNLLLLQIKLYKKKPLISTHAEEYALSFDISHDVVALVVLEIFNKL